MKILLLKPYLLARSNGGEISMIERLSLLQSWGAEVEVVVGLPADYRPQAEAILSSMNTPLSKSAYQVGTLRCQTFFEEGLHPSDLRAQKTTEAFFLKQIERFKPDLVWAHYTDFFAATAAMQWNPEKTWVILTDNEYPRQVDLNRFSSVGEYYLKLRHLVVASRFMQRSTRSSIPWAKTVFIPNPVESLKENPVQRSPNQWLFVNPTAVKGVDFMIELAQKTPHEKFLFVGNWATESPKDLPKNVSVLPRQNGLREVFSKSKGLLMPSVWQEAFGRLVLEAMAAGVPVISSDRGSLPETVGSGGLVLPLVIEQWQMAFQKPASFWIQQAARGFDRVVAYKSQTERRFKALRRALKLQK